MLAKMRRYYVGLYMRVCSMVICFTNALLWLQQMFCAFVLSSLQAQHIIVLYIIYYIGHTSLYAINKTNSKLHTMYTDLNFDLILSCMCNSDNLQNLQMNTNVISFSVIS